MGFFVGFFIVALFYSAVKLFQAICSAVQQDNNNQYSNAQDDGLNFNADVLDFVAYIMWVDGRPTKSELTVFKEYLAAHYKTLEAKRMLKEMKCRLNKPILLNIRVTIEKLCRCLSTEELFILFQTLYKIAAADDDINDKEVNLIDRFARECGLQSVQTDRIKEYYRKLKREQRRKQEEQSKQRSSKGSGSSHSKQNAASSSAALYQKYRGDFATLELSPSATLQEVKQAYRKLSLKCHPDRLLNASEAERKKGTDLFVKATDAYQRLVNAPLWTKDGVSKCAGEKCSSTEKKKQADSREHEDLEWAYGVLNLPNTASRSKVQNSYNHLRSSYEKRKERHRNRSRDYYDSKMAELERAYQMIFRTMNKS